ncbi:hypothetical protein EKO27_g9949 [Xylaria grammica]|uniref:Uncharacterized protein n=1 Tax=Xylaria grammica TaxID=363999 RepID=A0A439CSK0_9PEZI|nr:hypothetical protein EKO27_g9949 [Xylaria grammica]
MNAPVLVDLEGESDPLQIAIKEMNEKKIPLIVRRYMPDGYAATRIGPAKNFSSKHEPSLRISIIVNIGYGGCLPRNVTHLPHIPIGGMEHLAHPAHSAVEDPAIVNMTNDARDRSASGHPALLAVETVPPVTKLLALRGVDDKEVRTDSSTVLLLL